MQLKPLYIITHFYLISLSPDWPYRSTLTISYVACCQTHIPRTTIFPLKTHQTPTQYCATRSTLQQNALLPHLSISRLTISVNIDHTICSMQSDSYSPTDQLTTENSSNVTQNCATQAILQHNAFLPHLTISRLTISVNIDRTICIMQSDSYSPTDHLTAENPSNQHSLLCNSVHSTILRTSTSSHYLPTDHMGQHWPYHM